MSGWTANFDPNGFRFTVRTPDGTEHEVPIRDFIYASRTEPEPRAFRSVRPSPRERERGYTDLWEVPYRLEGQDTGPEGNGALRPLQSAREA